MKLAFDDVLISPGFSHINSRKDVDLSSNLGSLGLKLPVISAPMDTVTGPAMANALSKVGAAAALHRFQSIDDNLKQFKACEGKVIVSVGLNDWERTSALYDAGAEYFLLDIAHGAQMQVVDWVSAFRQKYSGVWLMVGNFANANQIHTFMTHTNKVDSWRIGVGSGSSCETRVKTGCGLPTLSSLLSIKDYNSSNWKHQIENIVADGGIKNPGDVAKSLAAGASAVMVGKLLAGTDESPGEITEVGGWFARPDKYAVEKETRVDGIKVKQYRGSASAESYKDQGKIQGYITTEGVSFTIPYKGPVSSVLTDIEGGLRSALTYAGVSNLKDFRQSAELVQITNAGALESKAHGKI